MRAKPLALLLPWYALAGWADDGLMLAGAAAYLTAFLHVPILRDCPPAPLSGAAPGRAVRACGRLRMWRRTGGIWDAEAGKAGGEVVVV